MRSLQTTDRISRADAFQAIADVLGINRLDVNSDTSVPFNRKNEILERLGLNSWDFNQPNLTAGQIANRAIN